MDKLSMWQLIRNLDVAGIPGTQTSSPNTISKEGRDWTQIFAEDIVERQWVIHFFNAKVIYIIF